APFGFRSFGHRDGSAPTMLAKTIVADGPLVWDSAGTRIAFTGRIADVENVMTIEAAGGGRPPIAVTTRGGVAQCFSPDGKRIAYLFQGDLWLATLDGATFTRLTEDGTVQAPIWWGNHYVP
ncbi:MAG: DPP IV N-terminal domain-containing protein, partial [bacterium]